MVKISTITKALLLTAVMTLASCYEYEEDLSRQQDAVPLTIYLQTNSSHQTRGYEGEQAASSNESKIYNLKVWLYDGNNYVDYFEKDYDTGMPDDNIIKMTIPQVVVSKKQIDVYVIGNAESVGLQGLNSETQLSDLQNAVLQGSAFTPAAKTGVVPEKGLPYSQMQTGVSVTSTGLQATIPAIKLTRAVSKVRFAFARTTGLNGVEITGIELYGKQIASSEYIFPKQDTETEKNYGIIDGATYYGDRLPNLTGEGDAKYDATSITWGSKLEGTQTSITAIIPTDSINAVAEPEKMTFEYLKTNNNYDGVTYETYVNTNFIQYTKEGVEGTQYHNSFLTYLRETDLKMKGAIYYRLKADGEILKAEFEMAAPNDFARNHIWTIYAYFDGGPLYVKPTVTDWIDADELTYQIKMSTSMRLFDSWLYRYDTDGDVTTDNYTNWATSHMAVSDGRDTDGRPLRSPQIQLVTTGVAGSSFELTVDNDEFEILQVVKDADGSVSGYVASNDDGVLTIPAGDDVYTYFYIVPKEGVTPANPEARVSLIYNDPVLGPQKVAFNYDALPGYSDDSSEIWAYYVTNENYTNDGKLKMYFQDNNHPLVPTPDQY